MSSAYVLPVAIVIGVGAFLAVQWYRRQQARRTAQQLGGQLTSSYPTAGASAPLGPPTGSGQQVQLQVAGRPALAWQRGGGAENHPPRLSLLVEYGAGLPMLTMFHHAQLTGGSATTGVETIDRTFRTSGDLDVWRPVLADPSVQQALSSFPLNSVVAMGARLTFESLDGVHLEPRATEGLVAVATAFVSAVPPSVTAATPTVAVGSDPGDVEAVVRDTLARQGLSAEQQQAVLALIRAQQPPQ